LIIQVTQSERLIWIYIIQLSFCFIFLLIAYRILKRNRSRLSIMLSFFYILNGIGFFLITIRYNFIINPIVYILYILGVFLINISMIFILFFNLNLLKSQSQLSNKKLLVIIFFYSIVFFPVLLIPNGITISEETNWFPVWSWQFFIIISIVMTVMMICPNIVISLKLYKMFEDDTLKKKFRLFFIGVIILFFGWFASALYNTWDNIFFRSFWSIASIIVVISSATIIYYTWGRNI